jgi:hypothetical protein
MGTVPIIYIEWVDAHNNTGWFTDDQLDSWAPGDWYCNDVGYLVRETTRMLVFAQRHEPGGRSESDGVQQWGGLHKIPKTWVRKRALLGYLRPDGSLLRLVVGGCRDRMRGAK